jgi:4'-phosphopantetheinyl transferase
MAYTPLSQADLLSSQIHFYAIDLSTYTENPLLLSLAEQAQAARFKFDAPRIQYVKSHSILREILIHYLGENPRILTTDKGKPYLDNYPQLTFNLSHAKNAAVIALTWETPLGVDIEYIKENQDYLGIAKRFFSAEEYQYLQSRQQPKDFYTLWTRKEAYLKCIGEGISYGLHHPIPSNMLIHDFEPLAGYTAALVTPLCNKEVIECGKISGR